MYIIFSIIKNACVIICAKVHTFVRKLCILHEKGYSVSRSSLLSLAEFLHFSNISSISRKSLSSACFITAFTERWLNRCECGWQSLLNRTNRRDTTSWTDHRTSFIVKILLFFKIPFVILFRDPLKRIYILV